MAILWLLPLLLAVSVSSWRPEANAPGVLASEQGVVRKGVEALLETPAANATPTLSGTVDRELFLSMTNEQDVSGSDSGDEISTSEFLPAESQGIFISTFAKVYQETGSFFSAWNALLQSSSNANRYTVEEKVRNKCIRDSWFAKEPHGMVTINHKNFNISKLVDCPYTHCTLVSSSEDTMQGPYFFKRNVSVPVEETSGSKWFYDPQNDKFKVTIPTCIQDNVGYTMTSHTPHSHARHGWNNDVHIEPNQSAINTIGWPSSNRLINCPATATQIYGRTTPYVFNVSDFAGNAAYCRVWVTVQCDPSKSDNELEACAIDVD